MTDHYAHLKKITSVALVLALAGVSGCNTAPSKTAKGAGTGAVVGGLGGAVIGNNSSMGSGTGIAAGAALGAITGGIIGLVQDARDRKEQDRLAQERAYSQELARKRAEEAKAKVAMDEELAVAQGFRISELELSDARKQTEDRVEKLKSLQAEKTMYLNRTKELAELQERKLSTEAEIARMEEELARLKADDSLRAANPADATATPTSAVPNAPTVPAASTVPPSGTSSASNDAAVKPGI